MLLENYIKQKRTFHYSVTFTNGVTLPMSYEGTERKAQNYFKPGTSHLIGSKFLTVVKAEKL